MLTISMIVKNEEKHLAECLNSVKDVADEIVIVDTGSDDNTLKIAGEYNAKICHYKWDKDFSAARNYALEKSSGDWILYLDADERLSPHSVDELKKIARENADKAFYCTIHNTDEIRNRPSVMKYVRLFPLSPRIKFTGKIHEQIEPALLKNHFPIRSSGIEIIHVGYSVTGIELKRKALRNLEILLDEYRRLESSYIAYQLGQTYGILEMDKEASLYFTICLKDQNLKKEYRSVAYRYLSVKEAEKRNWKKAESFINESLKYDPEQPLPLLILAKIKIQLGDYEGAEQCSLKAFDANKAFISRRRDSFQGMFLEEGVIIQECMNIALSMYNKNLFNYFFCISKAREKDDREEYYRLVESLINNRSIREVEAHLEGITVENSELILNLLNNYSGNGKESVYSCLNKKFPDLPFIKTSFGLFLSEQKRYSEAAEQLEISYNLKKDPSLIFYLVSIYLQSSDFTKIMPIIKKAESEFNLQPEISERLKILKLKVEPFIV